MFIKGAIMSINDLCDIVRETAYAIHLYHGHGHLEKVYENALVHRLKKRALMLDNSIRLKSMMRMEQFSEITMLIC